MGKMTDAELESWEKSRDLNAELLEAVDDVEAGRVTRHTVEPRSPVARARLKAGLSQAEFAGLLGVSKRTLEQWEQGRREPSGAAKTLIKVAERYPEILRELAA
jgi:putative transcriptional regulator